VSALLAIRTVLHPTDFSERSEFAFRLACSLARGYGARLVVLHVAEPPMEILGVAEETKCDLIVMGTHGRTGLGRLLMGSVAEQVVRKATCPVLTVKTPQPQVSSSEGLVAATAGKGAEVTK